MYTEDPLTLSKWVSSTDRQNFQHCFFLISNSHFHCHILNLAWKYLGCTHMVRHMGMCRSNGSLFHKKSLNMGPVSYKKSLNMVSFLWLSQNCLVFVKRTPENFEKWAYIRKKIPTNGYYFFAKMTLKHG